MQNNPEKDVSEQEPIPEVSHHIGRKLREMYDYIAEQPVPARFQELLDQLESGSSTTQKI